MDQINVGVIGAGWCGGIRANTSAANALVNDIHIAEINPERLEEVSAENKAARTSSTTPHSGSCNCSVWATSANYPKPTS